MKNFCILIVLFLTGLPLPAMAADDKLYEYLVRFGTALDASHVRNYQEADSLASKLYDDAVRDGLDKPDAAIRFKCSSGLDKVTPLIRTPENCGNVFQRLFIEIRKLRGSSRSALGKFAEAGKELQELTQRCPDFADCKVALAMHYSRVKDYDKALMELDQAARINPRLISIFYTRVLIYQDTGDKALEQKATIEYNKLRAANEKEIGDFMEGSSSGDVKAEERRAERLLHAHPTQAGPIAAYADIISAGRLEDAKKYASIAIAVSPQQPFGYASRADINLDLNLFKEAEDDATRAMVIDPRNLDMRITRALCYLNTNRLNESLKDLNFTIEHAPDWALPYSYRATLYMAQGDFKKALADAKKAVRFQRDDPLGYHNLGVCYLRLKMYPNAQHAFEEMVRLERKGPGFAGPLARSNLGRCYQLQNKGDLAKKEFDKTLIAAPDYPIHLFQKSATAARSGFRDQDIKKSLQTGKLPQIPFLQRDSIEDSSELYTRKLELVPRNTLSRYERGLAYACLDKVDDAAIDMDRFIEKGKVNLDRAILMAYLCRDRAKQNDAAKKSLRASLPKMRDRSFSSLARFYLGDTSESQVVKQTGSITDDTIIHCDLGYYYMTRGDRAKAKPHIEWVLLNGDRKAVEYVLALSELERMCGRQ